jgi:hypothetical protein
MTSPKGKFGTGYLRLSNFILEDLSRFSNARLIVPQPAPSIPSIV